MKQYSKDLRLKMLKALDRGMPRMEVAQIFNVSMRSSNAGSSGVGKPGRWTENSSPVLLPERVQLWRKPYLLSFRSTLSSPSKSTNA